MADKSDYVTHGMNNLTCRIRINLSSNQENYTTIKYNDYVCSSVEHV